MATGTSIVGTPVDGIFSTVFDPAVTDKSDYLKPFVDNPLEAYGQTGYLAKEADLIQYRNAIDLLTDKDKATTPQTLAKAERVRQKNERLVL